MRRLTYIVFLTSVKKSYIGLCCVSRCEQMEFTDYGKVTLISLIVLKPGVYFLNGCTNWRMESLRKIINNDDYRRNHGAAPSGTETLSGIWNRNIWFLPESIIMNRQLQRETFFTDRQHGSRTQILIPSRGIRRTKYIRAQ